MTAKRIDSSSAFNAYKERIGDDFENQKFVWVDGWAMTPEMRKDSHARVDEIVASLDKWSKSCKYANELADKVLTEIAKVYDLERDLRREIRRQDDFAI